MSEQEIFEAALERDTELRAQYLDEACGADSELRQRIENLLKFHEGAGEFFEKPAAEIVATQQLPQITEKPGMQIGPYKLLQQLGEGGMGIVYMAEQKEPVKRRVALKIIKPGMDTRQVIARFEAERQALAMMDHPNIAKVLDAGATGTGRPYFVMELVCGFPITEFCDQTQLAPRDRLELFVTVCQAVQHAHQKGIIHRDIKPTNVLVAQHDDRPIVKVIDFGVAKAVGQSLTEKTMFTGFGQLVGTLEYMSPEQAKVNQLDIDTRSDVYSLGVLLYELLTGSTPLDKQRLRSAAWDEMLRIIREEEPQKPSTRISSLGGTLPSVAAVRHMEPTKLSKLMRGDLDWIVMKALEKDRSRRYETANGFAQDVQRYLADEPVSASPPSAAYRIRKFARRNKAGFAVGVAVAAGLLLLIGTLLVSNGMLTASRNETAQALSQKELALREKEAALEEAKNNAEQAKANAEQAQREREWAERHFYNSRLAILKLLGATGFDHDNVNQLPLPNKKRFAALAKEYFDSMIELGSGDPRYRVENAVGKRNLADLFKSLGNVEESIQLCRDAVAEMEEVLGDSPDHVRCAWELAWTYYLLFQRLPDDDPQKDQSAQRSDEIYQTFLNRVGKSALRDARTAYYGMSETQHRRHRDTSALFYLQRCLAVHEMFVDLTPEQSGPHAAFGIDLARKLAQLEQSEDAMKLAKQTWTKWPYSFIGNRVGTLFLALNEMADYRIICDQMLLKASADEKEPARYAESATHLCLLAPTADADLSGVRDLYERHFPEPPAEVITLDAQLTRALFEVRTRRHAKAIERLSPLISDEDLSRRACILSVLALAYAKRGESSESRKMLNLASPLIAGKPSLSGENWIGLTHARTLFKEASDLNDGFLSGVASTNGNETVDDVKQTVPLATEGAAKSSASPSIETLRWKATMREHRDVVRLVQFLPSGDQLVSVDRRGSVVRWDIPSRTMLSKFNVTNGPTVRNADISADRALLALIQQTGAQDAAAEIWDLQTHNRMCSFPLEFKWATRIAFSPDGRWIAVTGQPANVVVLEVDTGREVHRFNGGEGPATSLAFGSERGQLFHGKVGRIRIIDTEQKSPLREILLKQNRTVTDLKATSDGKQLVSCQLGGNISLIDVPTSQPIKVMRGTGNAILAARFLPNPRYLISTSDDPTVNVWDLQSETVVATAATLKGSNTKIDVSPDGRFAATAGGEIWDEKSNKMKTYGDYGIRIWELPKVTWTAAPDTDGNESDSDVVAPGSQ